MDAPADAASPRLPLRPFGRTGLSVSPLGLAAWSIRAAGPGGLALTADDVERAFHEHGVNTFFAVPMMGALTEGIRRLVAAGHRDRIVIISMASLPFGWSVRRAWEKSARAFGTDTIDAFLLGWVQRRWYVTGKTWPAMQRLKQEGKVRALGFSCHDRKLAVALGRELGVDALMIRYNAAHRGAEREIFNAYGPDEARPAIISYTATRWGMLLKPLPQAGFPAAQTAMTAPECYRFVLANPAVDVALCAARTADELRADVAGVLAGPLDAARLEEVKRFGDAVHAQARGGLRWMFRQG